MRVRAARPRLTNGPSFRGKRLEPDASGLVGPANPAQAQLGIRYNHIFWLPPRPTNYGGGGVLSGIPAFSQAVVFKRPVKITKPSPLWRAPPGAWASRFNITSRKRGASHSADSFRVERRFHNRGGTRKAFGAHRVPRGQDGPRLAAPGQNRRVGFRLRGCAQSPPSTENEGWWPLWVIARAFFARRLNMFFRPADFVAGCGRRPIREESVHSCGW